MNNRLNKILHAASLLIAFSALGCVKPTPEPVKDPVIKLESESIELGYGSGTETLACTIENPVDGVELKAESNAEWLQVSKITNGVIVYRFEENTKQESRVAKLAISYGKAATKTFTATQAASPAKPIILLSIETAYLNYLGGEFAIGYAIQNAVEGSVLEYTSSQSWLTVTDITENIIHCSAEINTGEARTALLEFSYANAEKTSIVVSQEATLPAAPVITISPSAATVSSKSGSGYFNVSIDNAIKGEMIAAYPTREWVKVDPVTDNGGITYRYEENTSSLSRQADITVVYLNAESQVFTLTQEAAANVPAPEIILAQNRFVLNGEGGEYTIDVEIRNPIEGKQIYVSNYNSWIKVTSSSNSRITFTVDPNYDYERQANIWVNYEGAEEKRVLILQAAIPKKPVIRVDKSEVLCSCKRQSLKLSCTIENPQPNAYANSEFNEEGEWFHWTTKGGSEVEFNLDANNTAASRSFTVTWKYPDADDVTVTVTQNPLGDVGFSLGSNVIILDKLGTTVEVPFTIANPPSELSQVYLRSGVSWVWSYSNVSDSKIRIAADSNTTGAVRETPATLEIYFDGGLATNYDVIVRQNCEDLDMSINPTSAEVGCDAGNITIGVQLSANVSGRVQFTTGANWVKLGTYSNTSLTIAYTKINSRYDRTAVITITYPNHKPATFTLVQKGNPAIPANVVDLGHPDGILFATENIGASSPTAVGNRYAWGETTTKSSYNWSNYLWGGENSLTKYTDSSTRLDSNDDVAEKTLGKGWRMPTSYDWLVIYDYCTFTETRQNGVKGLLIRGNGTGKSIFLPGCGYMEGSNVIEPEELHTWCKDRPSGSGTNQKMGWSFNGEGTGIMYRYIGLPVRAVFDPSKL